MEPYLNRQFGFIDDPDRRSGCGSVPTRTWTRSDGPDPLLTPPTIPERFIEPQHHHKEVPYTPGVAKTLNARRSIIL